MARAAATRNNNQKPRSSQNEYNAPASSIDTSRIGRKQKSCAASRMPDDPGCESDTESELTDLTQSEDEIEETGKKCTASSGPDHDSPGGPQAVLFDTWRLKFWHLITHAGFFSHRHHDAGGLCTWMSIRTGLKIWGFLDVKLGAGVKTRPTLTARHNKMAGTPDDMRYLSVSEARNLVLVAGMVL